MFVQHQENRNTLSKTQRDVWLLNNVIVSRNEPRELENVVARDLDVLIANFLLQVRKKDGEQYELTVLRSFVSSFDHIFKKERLPINRYGGKGVPKN